MKFIKTIIIITSLLVLSSCDKIITILKNPNVPIPPQSQLDFQKVGVFSAFADGTFEELPDNPNNIAPLYFSEGVLAVFGIDKDGKAVQMKDENGAALEHKSVIFAKSVKSGLLFSTYSSLTEQVETYFTSDGKTAKKVGENNRLYSSEDRAGFKIPFKRDYNYFCSENRSIVEWNDKDKTLSEINSLEFVMDECQISETETTSFVAMSYYNSEINRRQYELAEINPNPETGETSFNVFKSFTASLSANHYFSKIIKINNDAFFIQQTYDMIGYVVSLKKINLESKEESVVRDFTMEEGNNGRDVSFLFDSSAIDGKIYIEASFSVDTEWFSDLPIYGGGYTSSFWRTSDKTILKLFSLSTQDGSLTEAFRDESMFVNYRTVRSGDVIYIIKKNYYALINETEGYDQVSEIKFLNLQNEVLKTIAPRLDLNFYDISLSNASLLISTDYSTDPRTVTVIIPPAIAGGEFIENEVFNTLNVEELNFMTYFDEIIFNFYRRDSNVPELGILKRDGTINIFDQKSATVNGRKL